MRHYRFLVVFSSFVVYGGGWYNEVHRHILTRAKHNTLWVDRYRVVDTWTEPGRIEETRPGVRVWRDEPEREVVA